tara:strand:- start:313 stop:435 length:123 start_codon:yes stop_codon:yes gene_type:complete
MIANELILNEIGNKKKMKKVLRGLGLRTVSRFSLMRIHYH